jgi:protein-disulfide isomerase
VLTVEPQIIAEYVATGRVLYVFRPVLNHNERSRYSSEAAFCAGEQGAFWPMHELLFVQQPELWATAPNDFPALMARYAATLELDPIVFDTCMNDGTVRALVEALDAEQRTRGINTQPIFEIAGQRIVGAQSFRVFQEIIDRAP